MSFESGKVTFTSYRMNVSGPERYPHALLEKFAARKLGDLANVGKTPVTGWCSPRFAMDREIVPAHCHVGEYLRIDWCEVQRVVPPRVLKAELKAQVAARDLSDGMRLTKFQVQALKREIEFLLMPKMPLTISTVPVLVGLHDSMQWNVVLVGSTSTAAQEAVSREFREMGLQLFEQYPEALVAREGYQGKVMPLLKVEEAAWEVGNDFLTWLLWLTLDGCNTFDGVQVMVEGPLTFTRAGGVAEVVQLRKGNVVKAAEAFQALRAGKKLAQCKLSLAVGSHTWTAAVDGERLTVRGLSVPADYDSPQGRMDLEFEFVRRMETVFREFCYIVSADHSGQEKLIREWIDQLPGATR